MLQHEYSANDYPVRRQPTAIPQTMRAAANDRRLELMAMISLKINGENYAVDVPRRGEG